MEKCSYDDCTSAVRRGNTICKRHQMAEWRARQGPCSLDGCDRQIGADGLCMTHYRRRRRSVPDWDAVVPQNMKRGDACAVGGCARAVYAKGHCAMHYQRVYVLGHADGGPAEPLKAAAGEGSDDGRGYRVITVSGQRYLEHRWVMEQHLGRPLLPGENVHHKNGDRSLNTIKNLELWITKQPKGQRVADLVAFVVERYPEQVAAALAARVPA